MKTLVIKLNQHELKTLKLKHVLETQKDSVYCVINPTIEQERALIELRGPFIEDGGLLFEASLDYDTLYTLPNGQALRKAVML